MRKNDILITTKLSHFQSLNDCLVDLLRVRHVSHVRADAIVLAQTFLFFLFL